MSMFHNSRDFGATGVFGNNKPNNSNQSQSQWRQNINNNNSNFNNNNQIRGVQQIYDRSLVPTTIKQILGSRNTDPEQPFKIDGRSIHQISIIATIKSISAQLTFTQFILDDYGAQIHAKLWASDNNDMKEIEDNQVKSGDIVKVIGKIDALSRSKAINIHYIEKIHDFNEIYQHGLEVIFAHEMNSLILNQHIPKYKQHWNQYMQTTKHEQDKVDKKYQDLRAKRQNNNNNNNNMNNNRRNTLIDEKDLSNFEKSVLDFFKKTHHNPPPQHNETLGSSVRAISVGMNYFQLPNIKKALDVLQTRGLIYDTVEDHYRLNTELL